MAQFWYVLCLLLYRAYLFIREFRHEADSCSTHRHMSCCAAANHAAGHIRNRVQQDCACVSHAAVNDRRQLSARRAAAVSAAGRDEIALAGTSEVRQLMDNDVVRATLL